MKVTDLKRLLVLNEIADDYEEPRHIYDMLVPVGRVCGISLELADIAEALAALVEARLAQAYQVIGKPGSMQLIRAPDLNRVGDYYFWITKDGATELEKSDDWWPFDDEGAIRSGWTPPTD